MIRIIIPLIAPCVLSAAPEKIAKIDIDRQTNDFISSDLYKARIGHESADVDRFVHSSELSAPDAADESDFFVIDVTDHIFRIRALFDGVPEDREALTIPDWSVQYKPLINRALYDFHTDVVSRTTSEDSTLANVVKQLHYFIAVFEARTVDEIFEVKAKVLRDLDLVDSLCVSGNYAEERARQLATFRAYADSKLEFISENCHAARFSTESANDFKFDTLSSLLAIARGLEVFAPDCNLEPFRDMVGYVRTLDCGLIRGIAPYFIQQTRIKMDEFRSIVTECTSGL
jgi:hypothetical protein